MLYNKFSITELTFLFTGRRTGLKMDFPQTNNATPFNFRPLSSQPNEKLGTSSASNRPKMSLPMVTKSKEVPVIRYVLNYIT